ncbi:MAG: homoserine dehydrogenase, partial [Acidimicrobiales bacterium]
MSAAQNDAPSVRVALLGCGTVGAALVEMLTGPTAATDIELAAGVRIEIAGIAVRDLQAPRSSEPGFPSDLLTLDAKGLV